MITVLRFNWPFYVVAAAVLVASVVGLVLVSTLWLKLLCGLTLACAAYFIIGSLGASHLIYDRSDLYGWEWLDRALQGVDLRRAIFCHCGFDEASADLRVRFTGAQWQLLDHFDREQMTQASIRRARAMFPPTPGTLACPHDTWPVAAGWGNVVFGLLAIHELRKEEQRSAWFNEARRSLSKGGRVLLIEHLRDAANFVAFGPGFLHFHSAASWRRCWESAGLRSIDQFFLTPFVRVFVLTSR